MLAIQNFINFVLITPTLTEQKARRMRTRRTPKPKKRRAGNKGTAKSCYYPKTGQRYW